MKIDVCLVTKSDERSIKGIEHVPVERLIIETSKPLGMARMRAIQKVSTEWFAFIDDDVEIDENWFKDVVSHIEDDVGAIQGIMFTRGLGTKWDEAINEWETKDMRLHELKLGERGLTHNTLIRTRIVKDWKPSRKDLEAYEDYEITQYVLKKGYRWIAAPTNTHHLKSWRKTWGNAVWAMRNWKKITSKRAMLWQLCRSSFQILHLLASLKISWRQKAYLIYFRTALIYGILTSFLAL